VPNGPRCRARLACLERLVAVEKYSRLTGLRLPGLDSYKSGFPKGVRCTLNCVEIPVQKESIHLMCRLSILTAMLLLCGVAFAESRFGRPVMKLANPKEFRFFKLDDNQFPYLEKGPFAVSCMTYRGTKRYYVEIGVMNRSDTRVNLQKEFVSFNKQGYTVLLTDTIASATDVWASVAGEFVPTPPPTKKTTTYSGTATTLGNSTQVNGTATTTVDNSDDTWHALGQAIAKRNYYSAQGREQKFAVYLATFAHEKQELVILPGKAGLYIFTFEQLKQKKAPFDVRVSVGAETFVFAYKE